VIAGDGVYLRAANGLTGCDFTLKMPSVGATANLMLAACTAQGETVIRNAAAEPHVVALGEFLREAGAQIEGIGTETVRVFGGSHLHGASHRLLPDMIEAGTYLCAGVATGGEVTVTEVRPAHLAALTDAFEEMGIRVKSGTDWMAASAPHGYRNISMQTAPYPGFPTDLHPQLVSLFALGGRATGEGRLRECIWQGRFRYAEGLRRMGADVTVSENTATVHPCLLHRAALRSPDLRGGAAVVIAGLAAAGVTRVEDIQYIERGYQDIVGKLRALGADIKCVDDSDEPPSIASWIAG